MKIAYISSHSVLMSTNGIVSQAKTWKNGLEKNGHKVDLINMWDKNDWKEYDIIHFFGFSTYMAEFIEGVSKINPNIICSPILDPNFSISALKIYSKWGSKKLRLTNPYYSLSQVKDKIKLYFVRSKFEQEYISQGFNIDENKCPIIPLSFETNSTKEIYEKENFCLHISLLADERKNVKRLIDAAKKYNFKLILAGKLRNEDEANKLKSWIGDSNNIEYKGFISFEEMYELYSKAKVFALPSTNEGVGIVALEAASYGCDIVITNKGGPKEYYSDMAIKVDPYDIDEIGKSVLSFLNGETYQPNLSKYIKKNYNLNTIVQKLEEAYEGIN